MIILSGADTYSIIEVNLFYICEKMNAKRKDAVFRKHLKFFVIKISADWNGEKTLVKH